MLWTPSSLMWYHPGDSTVPSTWQACCRLPTAIPGEEGAELWGSQHSEGEEGSSGSASSDCRGTAAREQDGFLLRITWIAIHMSSPNVGT